MIVYTGRKGLHIYDIDRENWVFSSGEGTYKYEDIYYKIKGIENEEDELGSDGSPTQRVEMEIDDIINQVAIQLQPEL